MITLFATILGCDSDEQSNENENLMSCIPNNLQNSVVAYFPFSNGSINDFSGNNQNLINTTTASSTSDRNLNENCAFEFDFLSGTNEYLSTANTNSLDLLTDFSISIWYQPLQERDPGNYELLIGRGELFEQWDLGLYDCRKAMFNITNQVWDNDSNFDCGFSDLNNDWHHLVATFDSISNTMKLYRNGMLQESLGLASNSSIIQINDLIIGKGYTGKVDDIIIFNFSLEQSDIDSLFAMDVCCE
ncbi:LamG domain-containing protein [Winogradskyella ludwigii]|uniref:LamG domain-containing protein n=1 Tax=Winogradskyella ludwigii TaxID=2686076 RepID=UPI0015C89F94|nr:LamG domain-containing protein [Winogradskyella ludwigii]